MNYRENYTDPKELARAIRAKTQADMAELMRSIALELLKESDGDMLPMYRYFSPVYDELYHAIIFKKLQIQEETKELLEILATPIFQKSEKEQKRIVETYLFP